ncbi:olfactory receptor 5V1-like [Gastrophryne carolinensis]
MYVGFCKLLKYTVDTTITGLIKDTDESAYRREVETLNNMVNDSTVSEFILLGFPPHPFIPLILFCVFFSFYMLTLTGNVIIIGTTTFTADLHKPMYFFLSNLSFLEIFYTSVTIPKMLLNFLLKNSSISFIACAAQAYFFIALGSSECTLLAVMAYDRYVAICNPLRYITVMDTRSCAALAGSSWISGLVNSLVHTSCTFHLTYCSSNNIDQFFCDIPPLLKLACSNILPAEIVFLVVGGIYGFGSFLLTLLSYIQIVSTVLKIKSKEGQRRAFSTCTSHLIVVTLFYGTSSSVYYNTASNLSEGKKWIPVFYAVITPTLNPIIYTLRNNEFKRAIRKMTGIGYKYF